jgi:hypothetical protein
MPAPALGAPLAADAPLYGPAALRSPVARIAWEPARLAQTLAAGDEAVVPVSFRATVAVDAPELRVAARQRAPWVAADLPERLEAGHSYTVAMRMALPAGYTGTAPVLVRVSIVNGDGRSSPDALLVVVTPKRAS